MLRCEVPLARMKSMATKPPPGPVPAPPVVRPKEDDGGSVVLERRTQRTKPPQMYQVVMLNDDYTPMEFVVVVIQEFFHKDRETATQIMLKIHLDGRGICGVFPRDIANTKVEQVQEAARQAGHPLQCLSEPVE
jgi:ATP-dependent Clp protease adaptor protein ClpS